MMGLAFTSPLMLLGLLALPAIWWLLRITPPRPEREMFPPLAILAGILRREESPANSPWWLTALRMALATLIILALAGPVLNPDSDTIRTDGPLVLVIDNGWASAPDWKARMDHAATLIRQAGDRDVTVHIVLTADAKPDAPALRAADALDRLGAIKPKPLKPDRKKAIAALQSALAGVHPGTLVFLTDGLADGQTDTTMADLAKLAPSELRSVSAAPHTIAILPTAVNGADSLDVTIRRLDAVLPETLEVSALDNKGRTIATSPVEFAAGATEAKTAIETPFELRNEVARLQIDGIATAASTRLLDDSFRRRRVALISGEGGDRSQPLLSPLYYIDRALAPFANLSRPSSNDLAVAVPALIAENPSAIIMADVGRLPIETEKQLTEWISKGGTLIRFAGPKLATAPADDPLIPVRLRQGERFLGGALSWSQPQAMAPHPENSPFFGLEIPADIKITRQVLAEPSADLAGRTWAVLTDGTPLVTARREGAGRIVLFHVSADASWSNLPISGHFVEMLRRVVQLSRATNNSGKDDGKVNALPPYRLLSANGTLETEISGAEPLVQTNGKFPKASPANPPGLYGNEDGFAALNLIEPQDTLMALDTKTAPMPVNTTIMGGGTTTDFKPGLLLAALLLLMADTMIVLLLVGIRPRLGPAKPVTVALILMGAALLMALPAQRVMADDSRPGDETLMARLDTTHLAYVVTGEKDVDDISERGLAGLSEYLYYRTTLEPGDPVGVDIENDELSLFPILYWPVSATAKMPSDATISRIAAYMRSGGTVLFDTRDQLSSLNLDGSVSPNTVRLQDILAAIDIPPLEPVPSDHVLTKSFYLLKSFPGRYTGSPLWVEALPDRGVKDANRPARSGDGVTPIMITGNDFAGAWAMDKGGTPLLPVIPGDNDQREFAYRTGVNIMMYMLTGNYKADQVHVPALLERLGQ